MQSILQSAFFQALGYAIANSLWQSALLWLIATIINNIGRSSASKKYTVSLIAQVTALVWFLFTLHFYFDKGREALMQVKLSETLNGDTALYEATADSFSSGIASVMIKAEQLLPYLSLAYLVMLAFLCIRFTRAFIYTSQIRYKGINKADVDLRLFVKRTAATLGIKKEVLIYYSELVKGPLTIGFLKPLILLPVASINNLSTDQLEAIILHELAHIRRFDYLVNIFQVIIEITLFFNPFVQLLGKEIKKERENSCDDWVLQFQYNPAMYAEALLQLAFIQAKPVFAMNASTKKGDLLPRVKRMLNKQEKTNRYRNQVFSLLLITLLLSTVAWFHPATTENTTHQNRASVKKVRIEPLAANIDNPLFNPVYFFIKPSEEMEQSASAGKETIPDTDDATEKSIAIGQAITPLALETLNSAYVHFTASLAANDESPVNDDQGENAENKETTGQQTGAKGDVEIALKNELAKIDWQSVSNDLKKALIELPKGVEINLTNLISDQEKVGVNQAYQKAAGELNTFLKEQKRNIKIRERFLKTWDDRLLPETETALTEKALSANSQGLWIKRNPRNGETNMSSEPDTAFINRAIENVYAPLFGTISNKTYTDITNYYAPTVFNNDYTYSYTDHLNGLDSALIIFKYDRSNDSSHIKKIILQIIGDNGVTKTYELAAEVYQ